jgi:hypothetical protein
MGQPLKDSFQNELAKVSGREFVEGPYLLIRTTQIIDNNVEGRQSYEVDAT